MSQAQSAKHVQFHMSQAQSAKHVQCHMSQAQSAKHVQCHMSQAQSAKHVQCHMSQAQSAKHVQCHMSQTQSAKHLLQVATELWVLGMVLDSHHLSSAHNLKVPPTFLKNLCTPASIIIKKYQDVKVLRSFGD
jgi:hypothetical protein